MVTALTRSLLTIGFVALVGFGCGKLDAFLDAVQGHKGGTGSPPSGYGRHLRYQHGRRRLVGRAGELRRRDGADRPLQALLRPERRPGPRGLSAAAPDRRRPALCVEITEGGAGTCTDYATYKIRSSDVCAQKNLFISRLEPGPACGNGGVESMTFVCCPPPAPSPVTCSEGTDMSGRICKTCVDAGGKVVSTDCNSNVPGMMCVKIPDGGATSCKPYDPWKQYGADACKQQTMQLTELVVGTTCGSGYQNVTYVCCATVPSGSTGAGGSAERRRRRRPSAARPPTPPARSARPAGTP